MRLPFKVYTCMMYHTSALINCYLYNTCIIETECRFCQYLKSLGNNKNGSRAYKIFLRDVLTKTKKNHSISFVVILESPTLFVTKQMNFSNILLSFVW